MSNLLSKAKDLYSMQKQAREMQKKMKKLVVEGNSKDELVTVKINGVNELEDIAIADELLEVGQKFKLIRSIKEAYSAAGKKLQKEMVKDMDMDKMRSMLGI